MNHAGFVRAEAPIDRVRAGWFDVWSRSHSRGLDRELEAARADPNRVEDQALERISKLGERRYYGAEAGEQDAGQVGVDHEAEMAKVIAKALSAPAKDRVRDDTLEGDL